MDKNDIVGKCPKCGAILVRMDKVRGKIYFCDKDGEVRLGRNKKK